MLYLSFLEKSCNFGLPHKLNMNSNTWGYTQSVCWSGSYTLPTLYFSYLTNLKSLVHSHIS